MSSLGGRARIGWLSILTVAVSYSCSIFPDRAELPTASAGRGIAGEANTSEAGLGGVSNGNVPPAGAAGSSDGVVGGAPGSAGAAANAGAAADAPGGASGAPSGCMSPQQQVVAVTVDTWIEAAKPNAGHGNDKLLSVVGGAAEARALFQVTLPALAPGTVLLKATLALHLATNADVGLVKRELRVHRLGQEISETRTTWTNWGQGTTHAWTTPGGDFGPMLARAAIPAGTSNGAVTFELTAAVQTAVSPQAVPLALIVVEDSVPPAAPAELAFTSREGDASSGPPALILAYCPP